MAKKTVQAPASTTIENCNFTGVHVPPTPSHVSDAVTAIANAANNNALALVEAAKIYKNIAPVVHMDAPIINISQHKE